MGKGPATIYKECIAYAKSEDKLLSTIPNNDVQREINLTTGHCTLYEKDVRLAFFKQNYSEKATDRALRQWGELDLTQPYTLHGHRVLLFLETKTKIKGAE